jgi:6-phosphogluconolactonase
MVESTFKALNFKKVVRAFIGTYTSTENQSKGLYVYEYDEVSGKLGQVVTTTFTESPSYLTFDKEGSKLYVVNEKGNPGHVS